MKWKVGDKIKNRYEIHNIKMGGMGIIYLCYDRERKIPIAAKTLQEKYWINEDMKNRFIKEAGTWIKLEKDINIVNCLFVENIENIPFVFMEYIDGYNLEEYIKYYAPDLETLLNFAIQFTNGMEYARYKLGYILHMDIKPQNILITKDKILKITDFGLTSTYRDVSNTLSVGLFNEVPAISIDGLGGTPPYMAPELFMSNKADTRSDIYSFGIVLYQMFTGNYPYLISKTSFEEFKNLHCYEKAINPLKFNSSIPSNLASIILTCLKKEPYMRFPNFGILQSKLYRCYTNIFGKEISSKRASRKLELWELINKAASLISIGEYYEATLYCDRALEISPSYIFALQNKALAFGSMERYEEAIKLFKHIIEIDSKFLDAWKMMGVAYYELGEFNSAVECFNKYIKLNSIDAEIYASRGYALYKLKKYKQALADAKKALNLNPNLKLAHKLEQICGTEIKQ